LYVFFICHSLISLLAELTMAALSIVIIGKNNEPLYMKQFGDVTGQENGMVEEDLFLSLVKDTRLTSVGGFQCSPRHQFIMHAALDRFEQLAGPTPGFGWRKPGVSGTDGMFVGLLCPVEEMRVYGTFFSPFKRIDTLISDF
jgi:hypothetical protein